MLLRPATRLPGITDLPPSARNLRIGLFGGSFNPVHAGHRLVAEETLRRLELDRLWVLVSPGNPLKSHRELAPLPDRVLAARALLDDPRIRVTGWEAERGFRYSWQTVQWLTSALPDRRFVWIMGADNLAQFHQWERWRTIAALVPMAVYVRPGGRLNPSSQAAQALGRNRIDQEDAPRLAGMTPPAWVYLHGKQSSLSSTVLRAQSRNNGPQGAGLATTPPSAHIKPT